MSGLVAARELVAAGVDVTVVDKGRSVGGRLATRRIGDARLDHGAQFFTARTPAFQRRVDDWIERDVVHIWNHGFGGALGDGSGATGSTGDGGGDAGDGDTGDAESTQTSGDGYPRYVGSTGMNGLAKDLAVGLTVETSTMVFTLRQAADREHRWQVVIDDGSHRDADAVIITSPLPQSFAMLVDSGIGIEDTPFSTEYDRTIGLLVTLDGPAGIPEPGGVQDGDDMFSFIGDNQAKGVSDTPAVTFHANPEWSESHWHDDDAATLELLTDAASQWLGSATIAERQLKKWRFATPRTTWDDPCWTTADGSIVLAGDAFAGPRVEGAHNSGLAAAHALLA